MLKLNVHLKIKKTYLVVDALASQSGFAWTAEGGHGITDNSPPGEKQVWAEYIAVCPIFTITMACSPTLLALETPQGPSLWGEGLGPLQ